MSVQPEYTAQKFMGCYLRRIQSGRIRQKKTPLNRSGAVCFGGKSVSERIFSVRTGIFRNFAIFNLLADTVVFEFIKFGDKVHDF